MWKVVVTLCALAPRVISHAVMTYPPSRNNNFPNTQPQGANGKAACGSGGQWPVNSEAEKLDGGFTVRPFTQLQAGGTVEVRVGFTATHQGHFVVELCTNPGSVISDDCFVRLKRDPTDTRWGPYSSAHPEYFILPNNECLAGKTPSDPIAARFLVPSGVSTQHGILRWYWQTGNSCASSPETNNQDATIAGWSAQIEGRQCHVGMFNWQMCGTDCPNPGCSNEQFKNCADIVIGSGGGEGANPPPPQEGPTSPPSGGSCSGCTCLKDLQNTGNWCQTTCQSDAEVASYCVSIGMGSDIPACMVKVYPDNCTSTGGGGAAPPPPPPPASSSTSSQAPGGGVSSSCSTVTAKYPEYADWCRSQCSYVCSTAANKQLCMNQYAPSHCG